MESQTESTLKHLGRDEELQFRQMVEDAGALWVGVQYGHPTGPIILFQADHGQSTLSLYRRAMDPENIRMALKNYREKMR